MSVKKYSEELKALVYDLIDLGCEDREIIQEVKERFGVELDNNRIAKIFVSQTVWEKECYQNKDAANKVKSSIEVARNMAKAKKEAEIGKTLVYKYYTNKDGNETVRKRKSKIAGIYNSFIRTEKECVLYQDVLKVE